MYLGKLENVAEASFPSFYDFLNKTEIIIEILLKGIFCYAVVMQQGNEN